MTTRAVIACLVAFAPLAVAFAPPRLFSAGSAPPFLAAYNQGDSVPEPVSIPGLVRPIPGVDFTPRVVSSDMTQYAVDQLTLNRVRDCAVTNKEELLKIMRGPEMFTRSGSDRMDAIVEQLVAAAPLHRPLQSLLIDGSWVKQGVWSSITHVVSIKEWAAGEAGPTVATFRYLLQGLVAVNRCLDVRPGSDAYTYTYTSRGPRVSLFNGLVNFKLPPRMGSPLSFSGGSAGGSFLSASPTLARILYLDSDVKIVVEGRGAVVDPLSGELESESRPYVYIKPAEFKEQMELRLRKRIQGRGALVEGLRALASPSAGRAAGVLGRSWSPLRIRDRLAAWGDDAPFGDASDRRSSGLVGLSQRATADVALRRAAAAAEGPGGEGPGGVGLMGELNWLAPAGASEAEWTTESDLLAKLKHDAAALGTESKFKVGDLMSGKLKKRFDVPARGGGDDASLSALTSYQVRDMESFELKVECAKRGLSTIGMRRDLVARLLAAL